MLEAEAKEEARAEEEEEREEGEAKEEDDADDEGAAAVGGAGPPTGRLWKSAEARARWLAAMGAANSVHTLALALVALRDHCALFQPMLERKSNGDKRADLERAVTVFYHAGAFRAQRAARVQPQEGPVD